MITPTGLEDQLLGIVVARERPDLESEKNILIIQGAENKRYIVNLAITRPVFYILTCNFILYRMLKETEDKILEVLSMAKGNILEDEEAINILMVSKNLSDDIQVKQAATEFTERSIDIARLQYQPIAAYSTILFFTIGTVILIENKT